MPIGDTVHQEIASEVTTPESDLHELGTPETHSRRFQLGADCLAERL